MANQIPEGLISHQTQFSSIIDAMEKGKPEEQILWAVNANEHKVTFELLEEEVNRLADNFFEENQNSFTTNCNEYSESINRIKNTMILIETNENAAKQLIEISKKIQIIYKNINGINSESIKELKENLTVITLHENLNIGNRIAINLLNEELSNLDKLEFENTTQSQNENYDVGCLKDRKNLCFSKILDNSINTPLIDYFYEVIEIYKDANKYNLNKTHYTKPENKELVLSILQETKECLQKIISEQKKQSCLLSYLSSNSSNLY